MKGNCYSPQIFLLHPIYGFVHPHQKATGKRIKNELSMLCQLLLDPEMTYVKGRVLLTSMGFRSLLL